MHLKKRNAHRSGYAASHQIPIPFAVAPHDLGLSLRMKFHSIWSSRRRPGSSSGDQAITTRDLTRDMNKAVSVIFTPERDVAKSLQING